jgi:DNA-binding transcriptional ArsR family regulator
MAASQLVIGSLCCLKLYLISQKCSVAIHRLDSKRWTLNLLVTLEALLAEQNVTKAASRLHLSQPAVSAQLRRLRDEFGDSLFS